MSEPALFDAGPYLVPVAAGVPGEEMSAGRRLTVRQALDLAKGVHPLTGGPLHAGAAPHDDRKAAGLRCGTCIFRVPGPYPKCRWPNPLEYRTDNLPRVTHGPATDVRGWWPACRDHQSEQGK